MREPLAANKKRAFSLVELVIVVVIIGVIAAIAIPRISKSAQSTGETSLRASLGSLRRAIDHYAAEHEGVFPGAVEDGLGNGPNTAGAFENQMLRYSNRQGGSSIIHGSSHLFGPYLRAIPPVSVGPNAGETTIAIDAVNSPPLVTGGTEAWVYNPSTGEIVANTDAANSEGTRTFDEY